MIIADKFPNDWSAGLSRRIGDEVDGSSAGVDDDDVGGMGAGTVDEVGGTGAGVDDVEVSGTGAGVDDDEVGGTGAGAEVAGSGAGISPGDQPIDRLVLLKLVTRTPARVRLI